MAKDANTDHEALSAALMPSDALQSTRSPVRVSPLTPVLPPFSAPLLAFTAGMVDTIGFILLGGIFLAHITGNFVLISASLSEGNNSAVGLKLLVLPVYIAGVAFAWWLQRKNKTSEILSLSIAQFAALLACAAATLIHGYCVRSPSTSMLVILTGVVAMAIQAVLSRAANLPMTTIMTGNTTQFVLDVLDCLEGKNARAAAAKRGAALISMFALGAIFGGILAMYTGAFAMVVPVISQGGFLAATTKGNYKRRADTQK